MSGKIGKIWTKSRSKNQKLAKEKSGKLAKCLKKHRTETWRKKMKIKRQSQVITPRHVSEKKKIKIHHR